jgi:hypothetical protein
VESFFRGGVNTSLYDGTLKTFPVSTINSTDRIARYFLTPGWQVDTHSTAYRFDGKEIVNFTLDGYVAAFSTAFPYLQLPRSIGRNILDNLGADGLHLVECDRRESLLDLVFNLGRDGVPFVLTPHEYIRRQPQWDWSTTCQVEISLQDEPEYGTKYIALGTVFLA